MIKDTAAAAEEVKRCMRNAQEALENARSISRRSMSGSPQTQRLIDDLTSLLRDVEEARRSVRIPVSVVEPSPLTPRRTARPKIAPPRLENDIPFEGDE